MKDKPITNQEYKEFLNFIKEYNKKKSEHKSKSLLYQMYLKFIKK